MNPWIAVGAINGFIAVAAGAFGAHALKQRLPVDLQAVFETGARYHMYHSLALVGLGVLATLKPAPLVGPSGWAFQAGIALFSGSLYALALSGVRILGAITPIGGLAFLAGWGLLAVAALRS
ncbi:MAG: DUF423 domain-containing protein [Myxococcaceae bacterium]